MRVDYYFFTYIYIIISRRLTVNLSRRYNFTAFAVDKAGGNLLISVAHADVVVATVVV